MGQMLEVDKRPCEMSEDEREALPTGPYVLHRREITPDDYAKGKRGRWIEWEEAPPQRATAYLPTDIFAWRDREGRIWDFGQWADGQWFKRHSVLG